MAVYTQIDTGATPGVTNDAGARKAANPPIISGCAFHDKG